MRSKYRVGEGAIPEIHIVCSAVEEIGLLHGEWCQAIDEKVIEETIKRVIETSPVKGACQWAISEMRNFGGIEYFGEHIGIPTIVEIACFIRKFGREGADLLNYFYKKVEHINDLWEERHVDLYCDCDGVYSLYDDFMEEVRESTSNSSIKSYLMNSSKLSSFDPELQKKIINWAYALRE